MTMRQSNRTRKAMTTPNTHTVQMAPLQVGGLHGSEALPDESDIDRFDDEEFLSQVHSESSFGSFCRGRSTALPCFILFVIVIALTGFFLIPTKSSAPSSSSSIEKSSNPGALPTGTPTGSPSKIEPPTGCLPDRFDNENMDLSVDPSVNFNRLYPGQFICSKPYKKNENDNSTIPQRYQFGLTVSPANLVWKDTVSGEERMIRQASPDDGNNTYVSLHVDGTLVIMNDNADTNTDDSILWSLQSNRDIPQTHRCLSNHDCPYYHIHSGGTLVVNWIADGWQAHNFFKVYKIG